MEPGEEVAASNRRIAYHFGKYVALAQTPGANEGQEARLVKCAPHPVHAKGRTKSVRELATATETKCMLQRGCI
jgi:hypothetical protein